MKHYLLIAVMFALAFASCGTKESGSKQLILYYSQTGATEKVAQELQKALKADMEAIGLENPYTGTYAETLLSQRIINSKIYVRITISI